MNLLSLSSFLLAPVVILRICLFIDFFNRFSCRQRCISVNLIFEYLRKIYIQYYISSCRDNVRFWNIKSVIGLTKNNYLIVCFFHYMAHIIFILCPYSLIKKRFGILFFICSKIYMASG